MSSPAIIRPAEALREIAEILAEGYLQLEATKRQERKDPDITAHTAVNSALNRLDRSSNPSDESENDQSQNRLH